MVDMRIIYKAQIEFVKKIAEDILANGCSKAVCEYAAGYAHIEAPFNFKGNDDTSADDIRINWGEAYCYISCDEDGNPDKNAELSWLNDEMGISRPNCNSYLGSIKALESMTLEEAYNGSGFSDCYDSEDGMETEEYAYTKFAA